MKNMTKDKILVIGVNGSAQAKIKPTLGLNPDNLPLNELSKDNRKAILKIEKENNTEFIKLFNRPFPNDWDYGEDAIAIIKNNHWDLEKNQDNFDKWAKELNENVLLSIQKVRCVEMAAYLHNEYEENIDVSSKETLLTAINIMSKLHLHGMAEKLKAVYKEFIETSDFSEEIISCNKGGSSISPLYKTAKKFILEQLDDSSHSVSRIADIVLEKGDNDELIGVPKTTMIKWINKVKKEFDH